MNQKERVVLESLMRDLEDAQDEVTHVLNDGGWGLADAKKRRKVCRSALVEWVEHNRKR